MPVFRKEAARSLIKYVTKVDMQGCVFDAKSKSIFEFARQMNSRHLKKSNPKLIWDFKLRDEMLQMAREVEYNYELKGDNPILGEDEDFTQKGGKKKK